MSEKEPESPLDKLIAIEWDIIHDLERHLHSDVSHVDMVKISNSLAYHVKTLNNLLVRKFPKRFRKAIIRRVRKWRKSLL